MELQRRRRLGLILWVAGGLAGVCHAGTWYDEQAIQHDGLTRWYRYYVPDVEPAGGYPVVLLLHGGSGDMNQVTAWGSFQAWPEIADEDGVLLVVPNGVDAEDGDTHGTDQNWNDCRGDQVDNRSEADDVGFIDALIDWAAAEIGIDPERVYATGESNGGLMSFRLAVELSQRIAATASFIAGMPVVDECGGPSQPVSVFICSGDEDRYMPWEGGCGLNDPGCRRGRKRSAHHSRDYWVDFLNATVRPSETITHPDINPGDQTTVASERYSDGVQGTEVWFYRVAGGGHNTPTIEHPIGAGIRLLLGLGAQNRDIAGAREAWAFLSRHTLHDESPRIAPGAAGRLRLSRSTADGLRLDWEADCGIGASYGIYRGDLSAGYGSIAPATGMCGVTDTSAVLPPGPAQGEFFLVVPNDGTAEGAYGNIRDGLPRLPAAGPCLPQAAVDACTQVGI